LGDRPARVTVDALITPVCHERDSRVPRFHLPARSDHRPTRSRGPAHRACALRPAPTVPGEPGVADIRPAGRGRLPSSLLRVTATVAVLGTVAGVVAATGDEPAVALDPATSAYSLTRQTLSAARPADGVRATASLAADDERRVAALAAAERAADAERAERAAARRTATAAVDRATKAARERTDRAAARDRAAQRRAERRRVARAAVRDPKSAARAMIGERGWGFGQFGCLEALWEKESGWDVHADNPSSSAYGIPQALPGSKMAGAGSDWEHNPVTQIRWGLGYIDDVYGSPCSAWTHSQAHNWY